jgi:hypothetical protein
MKYFFDSFIHRDIFGQIKSLNKEFQKIKVEDVSYDAMSRMEI